MSPFARDRANILATVEGFLDTCPDLEGVDVSVGVPTHNTRFQQSTQSFTIGGRLHVVTVSSYAP